MLALRFLSRFRALACATAFAAASPLAAQNIATAPPALPVWPDQAPSVYSSPHAVAVETRVEKHQEPVDLASFTAPPVATSEPPFAKPTTNDVRHLTPPNDRRRLPAAKRERTADLTKSLPSFHLPVDSIYTTGTALAVVLGLFLLGAGLVRRGSKKSNGRLPEEVVSVLGRVPLAARRFAELIRVGNKLVLISVTQGGAEPLAEITDPAEIDRIVGLCQQTSKKSSTAEFDQVFRQLAEEVAPVGFLGNEVPRVDPRMSPESDVFAAYRGGAARA